MKRQLRVLVWVGVEAVDQYTLKYTLNESCTYFPTGAGVGLLLGAQSVPGSGVGGVGVIIGVADGVAMLGQILLHLVVIGAGTAQLIPLTTRGGQYVLRKVAPRSGSTIMWGSDADRFHDIIVTNEMVTVEDWEAMKSSRPGRASDRSRSCTQAGCRRSG